MSVADITHVVKDETIKFMSKCMLGHKHLELSSEKVSQVKVRGYSVLREV